MDDWKNDATGCSYIGLVLHFIDNKRLTLLYFSVELTDD
jgi:hypothetical protein